MLPIEACNVAKPRFYFLLQANVKCGLELSAFHYKQNFYAELFLIRNEVLNVDMVSPDRKAIKIGLAIDGEPFGELIEDP